MNGGGLRGAVDRVRWDVGGSGSRANLVRGTGECGVWARRQPKRIGLRSVQRMVLAPWSTRTAAAAARATNCRRGVRRGCVRVCAARKRNAQCLVRHRRRASVVVPLRALRVSWAASSGDPGARED